MHLLLEQPSELPVDEPWYQVSKADPALNRVWSYAQYFCCGQLFRNQESGLFKLESSVLRDPLRGPSFVRFGLRLTAAGQRQCQVGSHGLEADPTAAGGALHPEPQPAATAIEP